VVVDDDSGGLHVDILFALAETWFLLCSCGLCCSSVIGEQSFGGVSGVDIVMELGACAGSGQAATTRLDS
jgi:hypothetical protein